MKRFVAALFAGAFAISLVGCGNETVNKKTETTTKKTEEVKTKETK